MSGNNNDSVKKSSIKILQDSLAKSFNERCIENDDKGKKLSESFNQRVQRFLPQLKELVIVRGEVPLPCWSGDNNPPNIQVYMPNTAEVRAAFSEALKKEIEGAMDARQVLNRERNAIWQAHRESSLCGNRAEIVAGLLQSTLEGIELLRRMEELALKIAEEKLRATR